MSPAPRPYSQPSCTQGEKGGFDHSSAGPVGTTSMCPLRISERPVGLVGRQLPTTFQASS